MADAMHPTVVHYCDLCGNPLDGRTLMRSDFDGGAHRTCDAKRQPAPAAESRHQALLPVILVGQVPVPYGGVMISG